MTSPDPSSSASVAAAGSQGGSPDDHIGRWVGSRAPRPAEIVLRLVRFPILLRRHRDLIGTSVKRELEARFQGTVLGWFWPLFHPLFLFVVYYFIFAKLLDIKMPGLAESQKAAFGVFMFIGILSWSTIAETLMRGTSSIVDNGNLIKKLAFPSELLPLNVTLVGLVTLTFGVSVFALACALTPMWTAPGWGLLWLPVLILLQGLFTYGIALFLATLHVFLRDTLQVISVLTTVWMFVTPIFWAPEAMGPAVAGYKPMLTLNPVYHLVQGWRGALMGDLHIPPTEYVSGGYVSRVADVPHHMGVFSIWAVIVFALGFGFFVLSQRRFADEV